MRKIRKGLMALSAFIMSVSMLGGACADTINVKAAGNVSISNPRIAEDGTVTWDKVTFGNYPQEAEFEEEPIRWRILSVDDNGEALLLADRSLDAKAFNDKATSSYEYNGMTYYTYLCKWGESTLRNWLNDTNDTSSFINTAFNDDEKASIISSKVDTSDYVNGESHVLDKIILLSKDDALNSEYGFSEERSDNKKTRWANETGYADTMCMWSAYSSDTTDIFCWWLLPDQNSAGCVHGTEVTIDLGDNIYMVRPVIRLNLLTAPISDAGTVNSDNEYTADNMNKDKNSYKAPVINDDGVATWECVYFGKYKQTAKYKETPIEWKVLSVDGDDAMLLADKALDKKPYNDIKGADGSYSCTWETSSIRTWLNNTDDDSFINKAFNTDEQAAIKDTNVVNDGNPVYGVNGGNTTLDKIFLLSIDEISNDKYGFDTLGDDEDFEGSYGNISISSDTRLASPTDYAYLYSIGSGHYHDTCSWVLRSPGYSNSYGTIASAHGSIFSIGKASENDELYYDYFVRPAMHVKLSALTKSGEVTAESAVVAASYVDKLITDIGTVTIDSKSKIEAARRAYDKMSFTSRNIVKKYDVLTAAEKKYTEIENSAKANGGNSENSAKVDKPSDVQQSVATEQPTTEQQPTTETKVTAPAKAKISSLKNKKAKSFTASWKKVKGAKGYEVQYALNKKFTKSKKSKTTTKLDLTVKKLKKGKTYYVRVRAYKAASDGSKVNGKWSAVKSVKIKK